MKKSYESETGSCSPRATSSSNGPIVPCGLIAWSLFNDTYGFTLGDKPLPVNKKNIAWQSDRKYKFGSDVYPKNFQSGSLIGGGKLNSSIPVSIIIRKNSPVQDPEISSIYQVLIICIQVFIRYYDMKKTCQDHNMDK